MPLSRSTSKIRTISSQPSIWLRVPARISRLRITSARRIASGREIGRRISAISAAPTYFSGTITVPYPGGNGDCSIRLGAGTTPRKASGVPTWNTPAPSCAISRPLASSAASMTDSAWSAGTGAAVDTVTVPATGWCST